MAALGKILRKGTGAGSALDTVKYERVNQDPSDNEEEDDDVIVIYQDGVPCEQHQNGNLKKPNKNHAAAQSVADEAVEMGLIEKASVTKTSSEMEVKVMGKHATLTKTRIACFVLTFILAIGLVFTFIFILPKFKSKRVKVHRFPATRAWSREYEDYGTESMIRLVDIDEDGRLDIIHALYKTEDAEAVDVTRASAKDYCKRKHETYPCIGQIVGIRGHDGKELWRLSSHSGVFELNCGNIDIDKDGKADCIATGRLSTLLAFDPRNGSVFWRGDGDVLVDTWNVYNALILPDLNADGVPEVVVAHGGDPKYPSSKKERGAGRLILLDGATGEHLGSGYIEMPNDKETYMSPVLHKTKDGSLYLMFGHGGETVVGSLFALSLPDFYKAVMADEKESDKPPEFPGEYKGWDDIPKDQQSGFIEVYESSTKGVMVSPVMVDLNHDGVNEIVMSAYDGNVVAYDGETLNHLWSTSLFGFESYSNPAPGYFNDDDVLDFMVHASEGMWPQYSMSMAIILDGKTGKILWSLNSTRYEMSSDLVAMTTQEHRDLFIFRVQGREAYDKPGKTRRKRSNSPYQQYDYRQYSDDSDDDNPDYDYRFNKKNYRPGAQKPPYSTNPGSLDRQEPPGLREYGQPAYNVPYGRKGISRYNPNDDNDDTWRQQSPYFSRDEVANKNFDYDVDMAEAESLNTDEAEDEEALPTMIMPTCKDNIYDYTTEIFVMDRTTMTSPLLIKSDPAIKFKYNVTEEDLNMLHETSSLLGGSDAGNTHLGKRDAPRATRVRRHGGAENRQPGTQISNNPSVTCSMLLLEERTTGALGDIDGDGRLDLVGAEIYGGELTDEYGNYIRQKFRTNIYKINLERDMRSSVLKHKNVKAKVSANMAKGKSDTNLENLRLRKWTSQPWREYMGSQGDSVYRS